MNGKYFIMYTCLRTLKLSTLRSFVNVTDGAITSSSSSAGIGYATGAGSTVTQATSKATGVTINAVSGVIITDDASLAAGAEVTFTVTNSAVAATDVILLSLGTTTTGTPFAFVSDVSAGSFDITITNLHASTANTSAEGINFVVIKAVTA